MAQAVGDIAARRYQIYRPLPPGDGSRFALSLWNSTQQQPVRGLETRNRSIASFTPAALAFCRLTRRAGDGPCSDPCG